MNEREVKRIVLDMLELGYVLGGGVQDDDDVLTPYLRWIANERAKPGDRPKDCRQSWGADDPRLNTFSALGGGEYLRVYFAQRERVVQMTIVDQHESLRRTGRDALIWAEGGGLWVRSHTYPLLNGAGLHIRGTDRTSDQKACIYTYPTVEAGQEAIRQLVTLVAQVDRECGERLAKAEVDAEMRGWVEASPGPEAGDVIFIPRGDTAAVLHLIEGRTPVVRWPSGGLIACHDIQNQRDCTVISRRNFKFGDRVTRKSDEARGTIVKVFACEKMFQPDNFQMFQPDDFQWCPRTRMPNRADYIITSCEE